MLRISQLIAAAYLIIAVALVGLTAVNGPVATAPFPLALGPNRDPVVVTIAYGTEKRLWLEEAVRRFATTNPRVDGHPIQVVLEGIGSRDTVTRIVAGELQPTVISPASSIQVELLRDDWQRKTNTNIVHDGSDAPQPLVLTPLVLVAWEERAAVLWPNPQANFWSSLHDALADPQGWATRGRPEWGLVKFGHTSPLSSNSGIQTLVLLAYGFHNKASNLTSADIFAPAFQSWLIDVERAVLEFGDSTGTFMTDMVLFGPSKYDIVAVYENVAIENIQAAEGRWGKLRLYYPPATIFSDHPYAILNATWVSPLQRQAAAQFREFLLTEQTQTLALQYGFRPANPQVALITNDANNPFNKYRGYGVQLDIQQQVAIPSAEVLNNLTELWRRNINK